MSSITVLGTLGLLHVLFLPGALLLSALKLEATGVQRVLLALPLSLGINYVLVTLLAGLGLFHQATVIAVVALECVAVAALIFAPRIRLAFRPGAPNRTYKDVLFLGACVAGVAWFSLYFVDAFSHVFVSGDSIASWNRWALDWAEGRQPTFTMTYPQVIPAAWGTLYTLMGEPIQFVARGMMPVFSLAILLVFLDLARRRGDLSYAAGGVITVFLIESLLENYIGEGYVDLPVAFCGLAAAYALLSAAPR